jgi:hypothetical protein
MQPGARRRERAREVARARTISEVKRTRGGLSGYCSVKVILSEKMPPSHGVSSGPKTVPPQTSRLSSPIGLAETPSGGCCFIVRRSDLHRSSAGVRFGGKCGVGRGGVGLSTEVATRRTGGVRRACGGLPRTSGASGIPGESLIRPSASLWAVETLDANRTKGEPNPTNRDAYSSRSIDAGVHLVTVVD